MFGMKFIAVVIIATLFGCAANLFAEPSAQEKTAVLEDLVAEALINNPQIQAAYNNWKAAEHKIKQASSLPDPMASYAYFGKNVETRVGPVLSQNEWK